MPDQNEKRMHPRYLCDGGVEVRSGDSRGFWGTLTDISEGGCYVQSFSPMPVGTELKLFVKARGAEINIAQAKVVAFHPGVGMGVQFTLTEEEESAKLVALIEQLSKSEQPTTFGGTIVH